MGRGAARTAVDQIGTIADCLSGLAAFLEEAKPAEIRLLGEMLGDRRKMAAAAAEVRQARSA